MGQKVHPKGLRIGIIYDWDSRWFARKNFSQLLLEDKKIRDFVREKLSGAGISRIEIERKPQEITLIIHAAKPGVVIGRGGTGIETLRKELSDLTGKRVIVHALEVKNPELDAQLVAENVAEAIERRVSYRRAMKQAVSRAMRLGAKGIKIRVSGRLQGAEIARSERIGEGTVPLHTLRADVDYGFAEAHTTYGRIGIKVWIYKGDILPSKIQAAEGGK
ncbi:MAG TPA: 30S ribosomal protein S3 [Firmicutes bacterium]|uniref:Small ribosomal subunit protein uS3 n=1 Tax=Candidatus Fermentithermobacillus carboniphilus TaxID=3085328 RepID=A0AAT9LBZ1_9FIRM|nr:MAG: 30S ribosomal protein S3 [Candidatus Fermentithermobacillus carboniphilus]HHW18380.1 30S ribosomal protein S3 [Candidatus Fermentithermobacillaceae bacterium]